MNWIGNSHFNNFYTCVVGHKKQFTCESGDSAAKGFFVRIRLAVVKCFFFIEVLTWKEKRCANEHSKNRYVYFLLFLYFKNIWRVSWLRMWEIDYQIQVLTVLNRSRSCWLVYCNILTYIHKECRIQNCFAEKSQVPSNVNSYSVLIY